MAEFDLGLGIAENYKTPSLDPNALVKGFQLGLQQDAAEGARALRAQKREEDRQKKLDDLISKSVTYEGIHYLDVPEAKERIQPLIKEATNLYSKNRNLSEATQKINEAALIADEIKSRKPNREQFLNAKNLSPWAEDVRKTALSTGDARKAKGVSGAWGEGRDPNSNLFVYGDTPLVDGDKLLDQEFARYADQPRFIKDTQGNMVAVGKGLFRTESERRKALPQLQELGLTDKDVASAEMIAAQTWEDPAVKKWFYVKNRKTVDDLLSKGKTTDEIDAELFPKYLKLAEDKAVTKVSVQNKSVDKNSNINLGAGSSQAGGFVFTSTAQTNNQYQPTPQESVEFAAQSFRKNNPALSKAQAKALAEDFVKRGGKLKPIQATTEVITNVNPSKIGGADEEVTLTLSDGKTQKRGKASKIKTVYDPETGEFITGSLIFTYKEDGEDVTEEVPLTETNYGAWVNRLGGVNVDKQIKENTGGKYGLPMSFSASSTQTGSKSSGIQTGQNKTKKSQLDSAVEAFAKKYNRQPTASELEKLKAKYGS